MKPSNAVRLACAALALALPAPWSWAQTAAAEPVAGSATATAPHAGFAAPVDAAALDAHRGGTQVVLNDMTLAGTTAGNTASQLVTGSNAISAGAFSNMSGLPLVIQNSGANVLIQNAVIVHLQME